MEQPEYYTKRDQYTAVRLTKYERKLLKELHEYYNQNPDIKISKGVIMATALLKHHNEIFSKKGRDVQEE